MGEMRGAEGREGKREGGRMKGDTRCENDGREVRARGKRG